jgi:hypothetical protein
MRRVRVTLALLAALAPGCLAAQRVDSLAQQFEVDFAIPDAPAFELLDVDESSMLRPTTVRAFTVGLANFFKAEDGGFQVPDAIAVEAAPLLLARGPRLTLPQYRASATLYRTRVSAAAQRNAATGALTGIALGLRTSLRDDADLRTDTTYIREATSLATAINAVYTGARRRIGPPPAPIVLTEAEQDSINRLIEPFRKQWAQTRWNATAFDLAAGVVAASADSLGNDLEVGALAAWGTWALGLGDWGQLLIGGRGTFGRNDPDEGRVLGGDLGARFYAGTNAYKIFVEGQGTLANESASGWLLNTGGEARLLDRLWANFSAAITWDENGDARLSGRFTVKGAAPPLF